MSNVSGEVKGDSLILTINLKAPLTVSKAEATKAAEQKREPKASLLASTGGFIQFGDVKVSLNAMR
jgi:hypothetical protein